MTRPTRAIYQPDTTLPAADGWCEATVLRSPGDSQSWGSDGDRRYCFTMARFEQDGRRCCGLHLGKRIIWGPR